MENLFLPLELTLRIIAESYRYDISIETNKLMGESKLFTMPMDYDDETKILKQMIEDGIRDIIHVSFNGFFQYKGLHFAHYEGKLYRHRKSRNSNIILKSIDDNGITFVKVRDRTEFLEAERSKIILPPKQINLHYSKSSEEETAYFTRRYYKTKVFNRKGTFSKDMKTIEKALTACCLYAKETSL